MLLTVNFPVKPHVHKYLLKKIGKRLVVSKRSFYGSMVLDILSKKYSDLQKIKSTLTYPVDISEKYMNENGIYINNKIILKFNRGIDLLFREGMYTYVALSMKKGSKKRDALYEYLGYFDIDDDDIKIESLEKDLYRNLKTDKKNFYETVR